MPSSRSNKPSTSTPQKPTDSIHEKLDLILQRLDKFDTRLTKLETEQKEVTRGLNFMSTEIQEIRDSLKDVNADKIASLEQEIDQMNDQANRKNLIIDGIPYKKDEDLFKALELFSNQIECDLNPATDINNLYRIKEHDKIVVQFLQVYKRDKFLARCKSVQVTADKLGFKSIKNRIYVNEMLSPKQATLFHKVRVFRKANGYKFAWTKNQRIFLRKTPDTDVIQIRKLEDLSQLK